MFFLIGAIFLVSFWDFLASGLPVSDATYVALTQAPEVFIFIGMLVTQGSHRLHYGSFGLIGRKIDIILVLLVAWIILSSVTTAADLRNIGSANAAISVLNIKAFLRYLSIFYVASAIKWDKQKYLKIRNCILIVFLLQVFIGALQFIIGAPALEFFGPRSVEQFLGVARTSFVERDSTEVFGTFRNTISFAYIMLIGTIIILVSNTNIGPFRPKILSIVALFLIYISGSRIVFLLASLIIVAYVFRIQIAKIRRRRMLVLISLSLFAVITSYSYILSLDLQFSPGSMGFVFSRSYIEAAMNQRLGVVSIIVPQLTKDLGFWIGLGADQNFVAKYVIQNTYIPNYALMASLYQTLEDVYWIAFLLYFGIPGLLLLLIFMRRLYSATYEIGASTNHWSVEPARIARILLLLAIPLNFVNQAFEVQIYSLPLWLFTAIALRAGLTSWRLSVRATAAHRTAAGAPAPAGP